MSRLSAVLSSSAAARARAATVAAILSTLALACSGHEQGTDDTTAAAGAAATPAASTSQGDDKGSVHLEVVGGPHAGSYDEKMIGTGCSYGLAGQGAWGNQYSVDTQDPKKFSSLQLIVPDAKGAAGGTSAFQMTVAFGPLFGSGGTSYDVNTRPDAPAKTGSGRVTVEDHGSTGRVTFDGKTAQGVELKGTIDCKGVVRAGQG